MWIGRAAGGPPKGWWRRWDSNPRPKRKNQDVYARILRLGLALGAARRRATPSASGHVDVEEPPATQGASSLLNDTSPPSRHPGFSVAALVRPREERRKWRLNFPGEGRGTLGSPARGQGFNRPVENLSPPQAQVPTRARRPVYSHRIDSVSSGPPPFSARPRFARIPVRPPPFPKGFGGSPEAP